MKGLLKLALLFIFSPIWVGEMMIDALKEIGEGVHQDNWLPEKEKSFFERITDW